MLESHQLSSYVYRWRTFSMMPLKVPLWELSEINFICSLITVHAFRLIPPTSPNNDLPLLSPPRPSRCHFQSYFKTMCDYLWHCLTCASRRSLSLFLSLLSLPLFLLLARSAFLCLANQKAKPRRLLRANNNPAPVYVWSWQSDRSAVREKTHSDRPPPPQTPSSVLKRTRYFSPNISCTGIFY